MRLAAALLRMFVKGGRVLQKNAQDWVHLLAGAMQDVREGPL